MSAELLFSARIADNNGLLPMLVVTDRKCPEINLLHSKPVIQQIRSPTNFGLSLFFPHDNRISCIVIPKIAVVFAVFVYFGFGCAVIINRAIP